MDNLAQGRRNRPLPEGPVMILFFFEVGADIGMRVFRLKPCYLASVSAIQVVDCDSS